MCQTARSRRWICCCQRRSISVSCQVLRMPHRDVCPTLHEKRRCQGLPTWEGLTRRFLFARVHEIRSLHLVSQSCRNSQCRVAHADRSNTACRAGRCCTQSESLRSRSGIPNKAGTVGSKGSSFCRRTPRISGCEEETVSTENGASSTPLDALVRQWLCFVTILPVCSSLPREGTLYRSAPL